MAEYSGFKFIPSSDIFAEQAPLLDAIDALKNNSVNPNIDFPKWVVVGDQNVGKSSVMEAISGIPFPVQDQVCTRFPIQLELRHSREEAPGTDVELTIVPAAGDPSAKRLKNFIRRASDMSRLPELIEEASKEMGILSSFNPGTSVKPDQSMFSKSLLRIYASGPKLPCLSIVDLPGIYSSTTHDQNEAGKGLVKEITQEYAREENSIILLIVSAPVGYVSSTVPDLIKGFKGVEKRTLGVMTRLDEVNKTDLVQDTINGKISGLEIQWHCLRNLSERERKGMDSYSAQKKRDEEEESFFQKPDWKSIPEDQKGITHLRKKLQEMLREAIGKNASYVMKQLTSLTETVTQDLELMGKPLSDADDQENYLMEMANKFEETARAAVNGEFDGRPFFGRLNDSDSIYKARRLRAQIREMNRVFACAMKLCGQSKAIRWATREQRLAHEANTSQTTDHLNERAERRIEKSSLNKDVINTYFACRRSEEVTKDEYENHIKEKSTSWDGRQYPDEENPAMISLIFQDQSHKWKELAMTHIDQVWDAAKAFVVSALEQFVPDGVRERLTKCLIDENLKSLKCVMSEKLVEVLEVHSRANPGLFDTYEILQEPSFVQSRSATTGVGEVLSAIGEISNQVKLPFLMSMISTGTGGATSIAIGRIAPLLTDHFSKVNKGLELIQNILNAPESSSSEEQKPVTNVERSEVFYKGSMMQFVGHVNGLIVERYLMEQLPQKVFSSKIVRERKQGDPSFLNSVVGEENDRVERRKALEGDRERLIKCLETLKGNQTI